MGPGVTPVIPPRAKMRKCLDYSKIHVRDVKKDLQQFGKKKILVARLDGPQIAIFNVFWGQIPILSKLTP